MELFRWFNLVEYASFLGFVERVEYYFDIRTIFGTFFCFLVFVLIKQKGVLIISQKIVQFNSV